MGVIPGFFGFADLCEAQSDDAISRELAERGEAANSKKYRGQDEEDDSDYEHAP